MPELRWRGLYCCTTIPKMEMLGHEYNRESAKGCAQTWLQTILELDATLKLGFRARKYDSDFNIGPECQVMAARLKLWAAAVIYTCESASHIPWPRQDTANKATNIQECGLDEWILIAWWIWSWWMTWKIFEFNYTCLFHHPLDLLITTLTCLVSQVVSHIFAFLYSDALPVMVSLPFLLFIDHHPHCLSEVWVEALWTKLGDCPFVCSTFLDIRVQEMVSRSSCASPPLHW